MSYEHDLLEEPPGLIEDPQEIVEDNELATFIHQQIDQLPLQQQDILYRRFGLHNGDDHSLQLVGEEVNLIRERVRQMQGQS